MARKAFSVELKEPDASWRDYPVTDKQLDAIEQNREWMEIAEDAWPVVLFCILESAGESFTTISALTKFHGSLLMDFFVNAFPANKAAAHKAAMDRIFGQEVLF